MSGLKKIAVVVGTRPEAIKLAPLIIAFRELRGCEVEVVYTGQHADMVLPVFDIFGIIPKVCLSARTAKPTLTSVFSRLVNEIGKYLDSHSPDLVIVQGDTSSTLAGALGAFFAKIPIAHVEAGLRTGNIDSPFPEEANRVIISRVANLHFPPTSRANQNLLNEGIDGNKIFITGNTGIDALRLVKERAGLESDTTNETRVLVTIHRRENQGERLSTLVSAICELAEDLPEVRFVIPVHPSPIIKNTLTSGLGSLPNVELNDPFDYVQMVRELDRATIVVTDSGGLQEEAPYLNKPVLVLRDTSERMEAIEAGSAVLVGTSRRAVVKHVKRLLQDDDLYRAMSVESGSPFGDGFASNRIVTIISQFLNHGDDN